MTNETLRPGFFKRSYAAVSFFTVSALAACTGSSTPPKEGKNSAPGNNQTIEQLLDLPFPADPNMRIQQGFIYQDGSPHNGIDYIKGELDHSDTWQPFPVLAAADGLACLPPDREDGNAVYIQHEIQGKIIRTYYGHLATQPNLPSCNGGFKVPYKRGQLIAYAGNSGAGTDSRGRPLTHQHFQVNIPVNIPGSDKKEQATDPYGLGVKREAYPEPNSTDWKCGQNALFAKCYEQKGAVIGAPGATQRTQTDEIKSAPVTEPKEQSLALDQQAGEFGINEILNNILSREQTKTNIGPGGKEGIHYLKMAITSRGQVNGRQFNGQDLILGRVPKEQRFMNVRWLMDGFANYTGWGGIWGTALGEAKMTNLSASVQQDKLPPGDTAQWRGKVGLHFDRQFRLLIQPTRADLVTAGFDFLPSHTFSKLMQNDNITIFIVKTKDSWMRINASEWSMPFQEMSGIQPIGGFARVNKCPCFYDR